MLLLVYLQKVLSFTLRGSVKQADNWQIILGGTALPSLVIGTIFNFAGLNVPVFDAATFPTYIGYGLLAWLGVRFFVAPYFIWQEQYAESAELRVELSKPERLVLEELSKHRAKARARLAAELEDFQTYAFAEKWEGFAKSESAKKMAEIRKLQAEAGLSDAFDNGRRWLQTYVRQEAETPNNKLSRESQKSLHTLRLLQRHVIGDLTAENLALQLPQDTELEKLP